MPDGVFVPRLTATPPFRFRGIPFPRIGTLLFVTLPFVLRLPFADTARGQTKTLSNLCWRYRPSAIQIYPQSIFPLWIPRPCHLHNHHHPRCRQSFVSAHAKRAPRMQYPLYSQLILYHGSYVQFYANFSGTSNCDRAFPCSHNTVRNAYLIPTAIYFHDSPQIYRRVSTSR